MSVKNTILNLWNVEILWLKIYKGGKKPLSMKKSCLEHYVNSKRQPVERNGMEFEMEKINN